MYIKTRIKDLQGYIRKLKKQTSTHQSQKAIERAKALLSHCQGLTTQVIRLYFGTQNI